MNAAPHTTVLLDQAVEALAIKAGDCVVDGTVGRGGHSALILDSLGEGGRLVAFDKDVEAIGYVEARFEGDARFSVHHASFADLADVLEELQLKGRVAGLLLDLGVSSPQLDVAERGFSFMNDGPLDMRMDQSSGQSAADWLAVADEADIASVLKEYGEERFAKRIARAIVETRKASPITTTLQLAQLIEKASPVREKHKHPATRSFQAIRIFINRELEDLKDCLERSLDVLAVGARLVVISFHSLEDRIVKRFMREQSQGKRLPKGVPVMHEETGARLRLVGKAIKPGEAEIAENPRARSAVMRIAEVLA